MSPPRDSTAVEELWPRQAENTCAKRSMSAARMQTDLRLEIAVRAIVYRHSTVVNDIERRYVVKSRCINFADQWRDWALASWGLAT